MTGSKWKGYAALFIIIGTLFAFAAMPFIQNGFTGKSIQHSLSRQRYEVFEYMVMMLPKIVKAVCPSDFADKVMKAYDEINQIQAYDEINQ